MYGVASSLYSYRQALLILGKVDDSAIKKLDAAAGAAMIAVSPLAPPVLGLVGVKNEAIKIMDQILKRVLPRISKDGGRLRQDLIVAAHTVIGVEAVLYGLRHVISPELREIRLTDKEITAVTIDKDDSDIIKEEKRGRLKKYRKDNVELLDDLLNLKFPLPSRAAGFDENLELAILPQITKFCRDLVRFCSGFSVWDDAQLDQTTACRDAVKIATKRYESNFWKLCSDVPDLQIWTSLVEHAATRAKLERISDSVSAIRPVLDTYGDSMSRLQSALSLVTPEHIVPRRGPAELLMRHAESVLRKPLLRTNDGLFSNLAVPNVQDGFQTPRFRIAYMRSRSHVGPSQSAWWEQFPVLEDLELELAGLISHPDACHIPTVILGDPGAGKSLMTEVMAARFPRRGFTVVHVPLRFVGSEMSVAGQIEEAIELKLKDRVSWGRFREDCGESAVVVVLDGLDELIQASSAARSGYLREVQRLQEEEYDLGRSLVAIVTSRTVVLDRLMIPEGAPLLELVEFDDSQIGGWLNAWNSANYETVGQAPLTIEDLRPYGELARQPLLLTMMALHAVGSSDRSERLDASRPARLYSLLFDDFIFRQVTQKTGVAPEGNVLAYALKEKRWLLSIAAFAMFNRDGNSVAEAALDKDLATLASNRTRSEDGVMLDSFAGRAQRLVSEFFFVHVDTADETPISGGRTGSVQRRYEFLHATFGEFLIAERVLRLLEAYGRRWSRSQYDVERTPLRDDPLVYALLAQRTLLGRRQTLDYITELYRDSEVEAREFVDNAITALMTFMMSPSVAVVEMLERYNPRDLSLTSQIASYSSNLVVLQLAIRPTWASAESFAPGVEDASSAIVRLYWLWRSGLDDASFDSIGSTVAVRGAAALVTGGEVKFELSFRRGLESGGVISSLFLLAPGQLLSDRDSSVNL